PKRTLHELVEVDTSTNLVVLILGILVIAAVVGLGLQLLRGRAGGSVSGTVEGPGFKTSITVTRTQREDVLGHLKQAAEETGRTAGLAQAEQRLQATRRLVRASVLWIDDHPDNNIEENLMLRELGLVVTQTLSSEGAARYLERAAFDLIITDLGRKGDPEAGLKDIAHLTASDPDRPIVVYTFDPAERADGARAAGAAAVSETPAALLEAVLTHVAG